MSWKILTPLLSISFLICACGGGQADPESAEKVANEISGPAPVLPAGPAPVLPAGPAPVLPVGPAPVLPAGPAPVLPVGPAPVLPAGPAPVLPAGPAPVLPAGPAPAIPAPAIPAPAIPAPAIPAPAGPAPAGPAPAIPAPAIPAPAGPAPAIPAPAIPAPAIPAPAIPAPAIPAPAGPAPAIPAPAIPAPAIPAPAGPAPAIPAPAIPAPVLPVENPVIEKSSIKATIYFNGLVDVKEGSASALSTWKCGGGKKENLAGYTEGEPEEVSNKRYAKRLCGIEYSKGAIPIVFINSDQNRDMFRRISYKETKIKILPSTFKSNLESVKVTIREDLNRMSYPIVPENNDPWPHIQIRLNDHLTEDIKIKGTFLDPEGKEGEFNATIKVHSISEEVYERWRKPEVSPVRVEFAEENFIFGIFGRDEKELYAWKCPLDFDGNLDGLAKSWPTEEEKNAAFDKATLKKGCGLIRHNKESSFIPLNWMGNEVITKRRFERPSPIAYEKAYQEFEKLYNAYGIQLPDDLIGFDSRRTAGVLVRKFPRDIAVDRDVRIPIQIVDDQDRASISYLNLRFLLITDTLLEKWSYKGD